MRLTSWSDERVSALTEETYDIFVDIIRVDTHVSSAHCDVLRLGPAWYEAPIGFPQESETFFTLAPPLWLPRQKLCHHQEACL